MCLRATLTSERWRQCRRHLIYAHFASTQVSFERWRLHGILFRRWSGWHVSVKWMAEVCVRGGREREGGLLGSTLTRFDTRDGRERRRTLRSTIRGSNWWTNTCKHVSIYHLYTLAYTYIQRSTFGPTQASGTRVTCVLTKGLKGRKEEMTPLQWQSTFWSIFLSSSRLHGLIPSFFTHFMRLFSFLTVCSCFLKLPFYSVVTIFCNFFFLFFFLLVYFSLHAILSSVTRIILKNLRVIQKIEIIRFPRYFVFLLSTFYQFSMIFNIILILINLFLTLYYSLPFLFHPFSKTFFVAPLWICTILST